MSSEPRLIQITDEGKTLPKYYVYYDDWTGEIKSVTGKYKQQIYPHIITEDETAAKIMMGILNPKKYVVSDLVDGLKLLPKSDVLAVKKAEEVLTKIPKVKNFIDSDVNVILYTNDYRIEVNLNQDTIYKMTGKRFNNRYYTINDDSDENYLVLYLIKKNNPTHLIETIKIKVIDIVTNGYTIIDLSTLQNTLDLASVDVLTRRIFKNYGLKIKQNYVNIDYHTRRSNKRTQTVIHKPTADWSTFSVSPSTEGWIVRSNFDNPQEQKIYKDLKIFLTGKDPNTLLDKIIIPYDQIGNFKEYIVKTTIDPTTCKLLLGEEGKNITFKFEEIEYVKSGKY
jgi:hypothetical protein